jgi:hypothetical protein
VIAFLISLDAVLTSLINGGKIECNKYYKLSGDLSGRSGANYLADKEWLMLNFTLPKEPSRIRVSVWRKLKKNGSVSIGQSMWLLPVSDEHFRLFSEIAAMITQNNGTAYVVEAGFFLESTQEDIIRSFDASRDEEYREFNEKCDGFFQEIAKESARKNLTFAELEENEDEYDKLVEWLKKITARDFFTAPLKKQAEQNLAKCKQLLDEFSSEVYRANDHE